MGIPCPKLAFHCNLSQVTCCSTNTQNQWEKRTVVYKSEDGEITDEADGCSIMDVVSKVFSCISKCSKGRERAERQSTCRAVNIYFVTEHGVTLEEAAKAAHLAADKFSEGEKRLRIRDFQTLEAKAKQIGANKPPSPKSDDDIAPKSPKKSFSIPAFLPSTNLTQPKATKTHRFSLIRRSQQTVV